MTAANGPGVGWAKWAKGRGLRAESAQYLNEVHAWRQAWRPDRVRVLLIGESHVAQQPGDLKVRVRSPTGAPRKLPHSFVRLVYCLGYGEDHLCNPKPEPNPGTWQFWDLFGAIADHQTGSKQPRKGESSPNYRISWKLRVLRTLQKKDVWLVDASVTGLYSPGGQRLKGGSAYGRIIKESYEKFIWPIVKNEPLEQVWAIGLMVGEALKDMRLQGMPSIAIISQPQDRVPGRYQTGLKRLVAEID